MSEIKIDSDIRPPVGFNDVAEFFSKRVQNPCPACSHNSWSLHSTTEVGKSLVSHSFALANESDGSIYMKGIPLVTATCKKCAYVRTHNLKAISKWIADGKPEFVE